MTQDVAITQGQECSWGDSGRRFGWLRYVSGRVKIIWCFASGLVMTRHREKLCHAAVFHEGGIERDSKAIAINELLGAVYAEICSVFGKRPILKTCH